MDAFLFIKGAHLHLRISESRSGKRRNLGLLLLCCRWNITILKKTRLGCEICFGWFCGVIDSGLSIYYLGEENGGCYWRIEFLYFRTILSGVLSSILIHETTIKISTTNITKYWKSLEICSNVRKGNEYSWSRSNVIVLVWQSCKCSCLGFSKCPEPLFGFAL